MGLKRKIEDIILSRSNSYQFYKREYEKNSKGNKNSDNDIEKDFEKLKKQFDSFKTNTDRYMDSSTYLLRTLLVDYELNEPKDILKNIQKLSNELLIFCTNVCNECGISWWLDSSNLLGAARHGNFIPWDDEVDIGMMRKDYIEFKKIINSKIEEYQLDDILTVDYYEGNNTKSFIQILIKGNTMIDDDVVFTLLNIIPYDFLTEYDKKTFKKNYKKSYKKYLKNMQNNGDAQTCLNEHLDELNISLDQTGFMIPSIDGKYSKNNKIFVLKTERMFPLNKIKFGENTYFAPNDVKYYLKKMYGDYLTLPRIVSIHDKIDAFRYNTNNDELFSELITRLTDVNSRFK